MVLLCTRKTPRPTPWGEAGNIRVQRLLPVRGAGAWHRVQCSAVMSARRSAPRHLIQVFNNSAPRPHPQHPLDADAATLSRRAGEGTVAIWPVLIRKTPRPTPWGEAG